METRPAEITHTRPLEIAAAHRDRDAQRSQQVQVNRAKATRVLIWAALIVGLPVGLVAAIVLCLLVNLVVGIVVGVLLVVGAGAGTAAALSRSATRLLVVGLGATPADEQQMVRVYNQVEGLCATMGLSTPKILVVDRPEPNALLIGTSQADACLVVTRSLTSALAPVQLEAVLAHELTHLERADMARATLIAAALHRAGMRGPSAGDLVHRLAGTGRELATDMIAVSTTRYPPGLSDALALMNAQRADRITNPGADSLLRWVWTCAAGPLPTGIQAVGNLDLPEVRIAALSEL